MVVKIVRFMCDKCHENVICTKICGKGKGEMLWL